MTALNELLEPYNVNDRIVQTPYLALLAAGSTGEDGSTSGVHLRWAFRRNLGATHLPKGDFHRGRDPGPNFNRNDDYVYLYRSAYSKESVRRLSFIDRAPQIRVEMPRAWVYPGVLNGKSAMLRFEDADRYDAIAARLNPVQDWLAFLSAYGDGVLELELPDQPFFAMKLRPIGVLETSILLVEGNTVTENLPGADRFVSMRGAFPGLALGASSIRGDGRYVVNLLRNPYFEDGRDGFTSQYTFGAGAGNGRYALVRRSSEMDPDWRETGVGSIFFAARARGSTGRIVWQTDAEIVRSGLYSFGGVLGDIDPRGRPNLDIKIISLVNGNQEIGTRPLQTIDVTESLRESFSLNEGWTTFHTTWSLPRPGAYRIQIIERDNRGAGRGFGLDRLFLRPSAKEPQSQVIGENLTGVRLRALNCMLGEVFVETYEGYFNSALEAAIDNRVRPDGMGWEFMGKHALTSDQDTAMARFDGPRNDVGGRWPRFNDAETVNRDYYENRWVGPQGLQNGVRLYRDLSRQANNPTAVIPIPGVEVPEGDVSNSALDMLNMAASDYHLARMLGLGTLDVVPEGNEIYMYLAVYVTEGDLDVPGAVGYGAGPHVHLSMSVPTTRATQRLPLPQTLLPPVYGVMVSNGTPGGRNIMNEGGYAWDGLSRFVSFRVAQPDPSPFLPQPFFDPPTPLVSLAFMAPMFVGIEHRVKPEGAWRPQEVSYKPARLPSPVPGAMEVNPIPLPENEQDYVARHQQTESGVHEYAAYGINVFSRAGPLSDPPLETDRTVIQPANTLLPPHSLSACLIQQEDPVLLTTPAEQQRLAAIEGPDKTLVRVSFTYNHVHDLAFTGTAQGENWGDKVQLVFRSEAPRSVEGAIKRIDDVAGNEALLAIRTESFIVESDRDPGEAGPNPVMPELDPTLFDTFVGGVLAMDGERYIIHRVMVPPNPNEGPVFHVLKPRSGSITPPTQGESCEYTVQESLVGPALSTTGPGDYLVPEDARFLAIENMADAANWGASNPLSLHIDLGEDTWEPYLEQTLEPAEPGEPPQPVNRHLRGIWDQATIRSRPDNLGRHLGVYTIRFATYLLGAHRQAEEATPVQWHGGTVRVRRAGDPNGPKKVLEVIDIRNVGTDHPVEITAVDPDFPNDPIQQGVVVDEVNFYPGYRVYLYADPAHGFLADTLLPGAESDEMLRTTFIGARSFNSTLGYHSPVSAPAPLLAQRIVEPMRPQLPQGPTYATRPDVFGRSTYSFTVALQQTPFALAFYRTSSSRILAALYERATLQRIEEKLAELAAQDGGDPFFVNRWTNLVGEDLGDGQDLFARFPDVEDGYRFPNPDRRGLLNRALAPGHPDNKASVRLAIEKAFTPLTEQPLFHRYIKEGTYRPRPDKQVVRDRNGAMLTPDHDDFDQAPMAKRLSSNRVLFTDFTLDGASREMWFYAAREIGSRMRMGEMSPISGPIQLINSYPAEAPAVLSVRTRFADRAQGRGPSVSMSVAPSAPFEAISAYVLYRTTDPSKALSIQAMDALPMAFLDDLQQQDGAITLVDTFADLDDPPYGEPLYYRVVGVRRVPFLNADEEISHEVVRSKPSKMVLTNLIDSTVPDAPELEADIGRETPERWEAVTLRWAKVVHNAQYRVLRMNSRGNWEEVERVEGNAPEITYALPEALERTRPDGGARSHHFRVEVENSSGLISTDERVFTL